MRISMSSRMTTGGDVKRSSSAIVLAPIDIDVPAFESIGLNYLLHCLSGNIRSKDNALRHLSPRLAPGGVMFGATLLHGGVDRRWPARRLTAIYNGKGIFDNTRDDLDGLRATLAEQLDAVTVAVVGCAALFGGRARRQDAGQSRRGLHKK